MPLALELLEAGALVGSVLTSGASSPAGAPLQELLLQVGQQLVPGLPRADKY